MKWFRGTLAVLVVAALFAAVSGVARADDDGGGIVKAKCSLTISSGTVGASCTTIGGVTYSCTLQRTGFGAFALECSSSSTATKLKCSFALAPFSATCRKE